MEGESTYVVESHLGVVSLLGVEVIVDEGHSAGSATTELGVEADDGDGFFLGLEHSGKLGLNLSLGNVGELGVDHFDTLIIQKRLDRGSSYDRIDMRSWGALTTCFLAMRGFLRNLRM